MVKIAVLLSICFFIANAALAEESFHQSLKLRGKAYELIFDSGEFCSFTQITIKRGKKILKTLKNLCGGQIKSGKGVLLEGKTYALPVKMGPTTSDEYLYITQISTGDFDKATFISLQGQPKIAFTAPVDGDFTDENGDGLLDILKPGGKGEPHGGGSSYSPYLVYVQKKTKSGLSFTLDEKLSQKYSKENNFEWHGSKYSEKLVVDEHGVQVKP